MSHSEEKTDPGAPPVWLPIRRQMKQFLEQRIYPVESILHGSDRAAASHTMAQLMAREGSNE